MNEVKGNIYYCQSNSSDRITVKTCTCGNEKKSCPSHAFSNRSIGDGYFIEGAHSQINNACASSETIGTGTTELVSEFDECTVTIQAKHDERPTEADLQLSLMSLVTANTSEDRPRDKKISYEQWLAEKNELKRQQDLERLEFQEQLILEHEHKLFMERENFKRWLENKIAQQRKRDEAQRKKIDEVRRLLEEQEKKDELNKKIFQLWLKRKESEELAQKLEEQKRKLQEAEDKKKRMQMNAEAYEDWLRSSVHKPRPVPLNRGIESLRSSVSVAYINPVPWTPNIEHPMTNTLMTAFKCDRQIY